jgi:hypothetical protein
MKFDRALRGLPWVLRGVTIGNVVLFAVRLSAPQKL